MRFLWKKSIHIQIISVISSFNDIVLPFIAVERRINADDLGIDADKTEKTHELKSF